MVFIFSKIWNFRFKKCIVETTIWTMLEWCFLRRYLQIWHAIDGKMTTLLRCSGTQPFPVFSQEIIFSSGVFKHFTSVLDVVPQFTCSFWGLVRFKSIHWFLKNTLYKWLWRNWFVVLWLKLWLLSWPYLTNFPSNFFSVFEKTDMSCCLRNMGLWFWNLKVS